MISSRKRVEMSVNTISTVESAESYLDALDENLMRETFDMVVSSHFRPSCIPL